MTVTRVSRTKPSSDCREVRETRVTVILIFYLCTICTYTNETNSYLHAVTETKPYYVTAKQTFNYAKYTKNVNFKLYSINVTIVNILFINKSLEE